MREWVSIPETNAGVMKELGGVLLFSSLLLFLSHQFSSLRSADLLAVIAFLYPPLLIGWRRNLPIERFGFPLHRPVRTDWLALLWASLFWLPFVIGYHFFWGRGMGFAPSMEQIPSLWRWGGYFLLQVFVVAFPEELFFRGYLQTRILDLPILKGNVAIGVLIANTLFATSHLVGKLDVTRLLTFFPGLLFAMLRVKTGRLFAPIVFHAACNTLLFVLHSAYIPGGVTP